MAKILNRAMTPCRTTTTNPFMSSAVAHDVLEGKNLEFMYGVAIKADHCMPVLIIRSDLFLYEILIDEYR